jgi:hypothetical protein
VSDIRDVPSAVVAPPGAKPSEVWVPFGGWSRRSVLAAFGGTAVAAGTGVLDLFPWSRPPAALAVDLEAWEDCRGYWDEVETCVPGDAYFDPDNCTGQFHRDEIIAESSCEFTRYTPEPTSCDGKNAWKWHGNSARGDHRMCSDGWYEHQTCAGEQIERFSICRTVLP